MAKKNIHIFISHSQYWCWMMILQGGRKYQMEFQSCSTDLVLCFEWYMWLVLHCSTNKLLDVLKVNYLMGREVDHSTMAATFEPTKHLWACA